MRIFRINTAKKYRILSTVTGTLLLVTKSFFNYKASGNIFENFCQVLDGYVFSDPQKQQHTLFEIGSCSNKNEYEV